MPRSKGSRNKVEKCLTKWILRGSIIPLSSGSKPKVRPVDSNRKQILTPVAIQNGTGNNEEIETVINNEKASADGIQVKEDTVMRGMASFCDKCGWGHEKKTNETSYGENSNVLTKAASIEVEVVTKLNESEGKGKGKNIETSTEVEGSSKEKAVGQEASATVQDEEDATINVKTLNQAKEVTEEEQDKNTSLEKAGEHIEEEVRKNGEKTMEGEKVNQRDTLTYKKDDGEHSEEKNNKNSSETNHHVTISTEVSLNQNETANKKNSSQGVSETSIPEEENIFNAEFGERDQVKLVRLLPNHIWSETDCHTLENLMSNYNNHKWHHIQAGFFNRTGRMISSEIIRRKFDDDEAFFRKSPKIS